MRPTVRPGLRLLRRDPRSVQLGLDWPGLTVLADSAALRGVVSAIDGFRDAAGVVAAAAASGPDPQACADALAVLVESGAVVDGDVRRDPDIPEGTWAAWSLLAGPQRLAGDISVRRRRTRVCVVGDGALADQVVALLPAGSIRVHDDRRTADLVVAACDTEPDRAGSDSLMHDSVPHLWASIRDLVGVVGPLVVPGRTACLRCVDLAHTERDPAWPTLVEAAVARPPRPAASDPVSTTLLAAWAVHEVALWASGIQPQTCTHIVEIPYGTGVVEGLPTTRHPRCGCGWLEWHDTMGA